MENLKENHKKNIKTDKNVPTLTDDDLDDNFKYEVLREPGGENFLKCIQCGTCTASCPVKEIDPEYNCRRIIRIATLGAKEQVLNSKFVWMCSTCYSCYERCPWDVKITDLMTAFKNMAVRYGYIHSNINQRIDILRKNGGLFEITKFTNKMREKLNLPSFHGYNIDNINKIFDKIKIEKIMEGIG
jgi:heterodisulfide reductase subunit C